MSTTADSTDRDHPIAVAVAHIEKVLDRVADSPSWTLDGAGSRDALVALTHTAARLAELQLRVLAHADEIKAGEETGATSTANWWAYTTKLTRSETHAQVRLARSLVQHEPVRRSLAAGDVHPEQARVICDAVDALPEAQEQCEAHLLREAAHHDAKDLRILGRRVWAVIDPDAGDAHEAKLLEAEEAKATKATRFTMHDDGQGQCHGRFMIPAHDGAMLKKALMAIAAPKHQRAVGETYEHATPTPQRLGKAFCEYIERYPTDQLPTTGGLCATIVVTMTLAALLGDLGACTLDTGQRISAGLGRRLACEAGVLPVVLGGDSEVLDLGRTKRFHTKAQRIALGITQDHCTHPSCDVPAAFCHVHHRKQWAKGGDTNLDDAALLCPRHHTVAHRQTPMRT